MLAGFLADAPTWLVLAVVWTVAMAAITAACLGAYLGGRVLYETYVEEVD